MTVYFGTKISISSTSFLLVSEFPSQVIYSAIRNAQKLIIPKMKVLSTIEAPSIYKHPFRTYGVKLSLRHFEIIPGGVVNNSWIIINGQWNRISNIYKNIDSNWNEQSYHYFIYNGEWKNTTIDNTVNIDNDGTRITLVQKLI